MAVGAGDVAVFGRVERRGGGVSRGASRRIGCEARNGRALKRHVGSKCRPRRGGSGAPCFDMRLIQVYTIHVRAFLGSA